MLNNKGLRPWKWPITGFCAKGRNGSRHLAKEGCGLHEACSTWWHVYRRDGESRLYLPQHCPSVLPDPVYFDLRDTTEATVSGLRILPECWEMQGTSPPPWFPTLSDFIKKISVPFHSILWLIRQPNCTCISCLAKSHSTCNLTVFIQYLHRTQDV